MSGMLPPRIRVDTHFCGRGERTSPRDPNIYAYGVTKVQGMRPHQQDRHHVFHATDENGVHVCSFFCVFDGHGGHRASDYCVSHLCDNIMDQLGVSRSGNVPPNVAAICRALRLGFLKTDHDFLTEERRRHGVQNHAAAPAVRQSQRGTIPPSLDEREPIAPSITSTMRAVGGGVTDAPRDRIPDARGLIPGATGHAADVSAVDGNGASVTCKSLDGTTAVVLLAWPSHRRIFVAHVGDSRVVLVRMRNNDTRAEPARRCTAAASTSTFNVVQLTREHKPTEHSEALRIHAAGGMVRDGRVQGILAMSRAIGNATLKPYVSAAPDINIIELPACGGVSVANSAATAEASISCLPSSLAIIGTDGLWDVVSNGQAAAIVVAALDRGLGLENAVEQLICAAGGKACEDNATALVVNFASRGLLRDIYF